MNIFLSCPGGCCVQSRVQASKERDVRDLSDARDVYVYKVPYLTLPKVPNIPGFTGLFSPKYTIHYFPIHTTCR